MTLYIHTLAHTHAYIHTHTHTHTHVHIVYIYSILYTYVRAHTHLRLHTPYTHLVCLIPCFLFYDRQTRKFGGSRFSTNATINSRHSRSRTNVQHVQLRTYVFRQSENRGTVDQEASINADLRALASYFSFIDFPFCSGRRCESVIVSARKERVREETKDRRDTHDGHSTTRVAA